MQFSKYHQTLMLLSSVATVFLWTTIGDRSLDLQLFALLMLGFFVVKKYSHGQVWSVLPKMASIEMIFLTGALLLIVHATGNLTSPIFAITYIHLFLLVFTTHPLAAILTTCAIALFHYLSTPAPSSAEINTLISIPIGLVFFLFAREQYHELIQEKDMLKIKTQEGRKLKEDERELESILKSFIIPKLVQVANSLQSTQHPEAQASASEIQEIITTSESMIRSSLNDDGVAGFKEHQINSQVSEEVVNIEKQYQDNRETGGEVVDAELVDEQIVETDEEVVDSELIDERVVEASGEVVDSELADEQ